jgi:hypothetical protein
MFWKARAGGQKVAIRIAERGIAEAVPAAPQKNCVTRIFYRNRAAVRLFIASNKEKCVAKPPPSAPHSDIDGVHRDERPNTDTAQDLGQSSADVADAKRRSVARPAAADEESLDDRS